VIAVIALPAQAVETLEAALPPDATPLIVVARDVDEGLAMLDEAAASPKLTGLRLIVIDGRLVPAQRYALLAAARRQPRLAECPVLVWGGGDDPALRNVPAVSWLDRPDSYQAFERLAQDLARILGGATAK
jgi:hypothetical protein